MKILSTNLYKEPVSVMLIFIFSISFVFISMFTLLYKNTSIINNLDAISYSSVDNLAKGNLIKFQEEQNKDSKEINNYNSYLNIKSIGPKEISYSYNSDKLASSHQGLHLLKNLGKSSSINKIKKITLNGVEFYIDDIKNDYDIKKKFFEAQNKSKDSFKTINIELK